MQHQKKMLFRAMGGILISAVALFGFIIAKPAFADQDPALCTDNGGGVSIAAFRTDGITNIGVGTVVDGESINYKATLSALAFPNCAFEGGTWTLTTPDGVVHPLGAVPKIGGTGVASLASALIPYVVNHANEIVNGSRHVNASTSYAGGISHADLNDATAGPTLGSSKILTVVHTPTVVTDIHDAGHVSTTTVQIGTTVHDKATVTGEVGGPVPTGTVTFTKYTDLVCEGGATAAGVVALVAGIADPSDSLVTTGSMSYKAHYNGDSNYLAADAACEPLTVTKLNSVTVTDVHNAAHGVILAAAPSDVIHDKATVSGTAGTPTGTVDFLFFTNGTCSDQGAASGTGVALVGGVADPSATQGPLAPGAYSFKAHYNGDATYLPSDGVCEPVTISKLTPTVVTDIHNAAEVVVVSVPAGSTVHDKATVTGSGAQPTGTVDFTWFTNNTCEGQGTASGTGIALALGVAHPSSSQGPLNTGSYSFKAHYNGDSNYLAGDAACEPLAVTINQPSIGTTPTPASGPIGTVLNDTATLSGGSSPTGNVTFKLFPPADATCVGAAVYTEVDPSAPYGTSPGYASLVSGTYRWTADYAGDVNNNAVSSGCQEEQVTINKLTPTVVTDIHDAAEAVVLSVNAGTTVHDKATVTGSGPVPTGTADFTWYTNGTCSVGATASGAGIALVAGIAHPSTSQTPVSAGNYSFKAHYNGDATYNAADGACEPLEVKAVNIGWCSHGYWKQGQHFDNWVGFTPNQLFSSVFENAFPGQTLLQVLKNGGGGLNALGRDTVGQLLNSAKLANPGQTTAQVISMFNAVFPGTNADYSALHAQFVFPHNCGLN